jgi:hypothetical protein
MSSNLKPEQELNQLLSNTLIMMAGHPIPKPELDLVVGIAKEMLEMQGVQANKLDPKTLQNSLTAATSAAKFIEMKELQKDCNKLLEKILDPDDKSDKEDLKFALKSKLLQLNKMDPNPERQKNTNKILNEPAFINRLTDPDVVAGIKNKWKNEATPENKTEAPTVDPAEEMMTSLLGINPKVPGLTRAVQYNPGDSAGVINLDETQKNSLKDDTTSEVEKELEKAPSTSSHSDRLRNPFSMKNEPK